MNAPSCRSALFAALVAGLGGCASSPWERSETVPGGKLYVPKLYVPLLPGSIYPDRKVPAPAKGRPALVVVCPEKDDCRRDVILERAAQRGMVVLIGREPKDDLLRTRAEASAAHIGWLLVQPGEEFLRSWTGARAPGQAAAIIGPPPPGAAAFPSSLSKQNSLLLAALLPAEPLAAGDGTILKLYSPNKKGLLPCEAFRDAVEWLAGELGAR